jgi:hypothetical protein
MSEPVYEQLKETLKQADYDAIVKQNTELLARLGAVEANQRIANQPVTDVGPGGPPILHHLHLVDGRVIANFEGVGTHYSDENGVTRIVAYYPANEPDPTPRFK